MEFDEHDYLEKSAEDAPRSKRTKKEEEAHRHGPRRRGEHDKELGGEDEKEAKRSRAERNDRERSSRREKERRRSGEKERDRDEERRSRERDRDEERERERRREREREKEREREPERERERRSSSRSRMLDREIEREFERSGSRDGARRERELEREIIKSRSSREKKEEVEPEADPERDQRTVFAYQMSLKATERDLYDFFSKAGKVRDVRLIMDRNSRRSKGVGYCEFYDALSVPMAIALSGQLLLGQPVMVKPSEAEKNLVQTNTSATGVVGAVAARKIYVGNLPVNMTEDQLRQVFESFGQVEVVQLPLNLETGHCRGYGFVQFAQVGFAKAAQTLDGKLEIAGCTIKVSSVTDHVSGGVAATNAAADLDDDEGGGLSLNAQTRASLMQKLDRTGTATSIAGSLGIPFAINGQAVAPASLPALSSPLQEPIGQPSECVLLKNMFDPSTETDPDFHLDIKDEVEEECLKFGQVKHSFVDKNSKGHVYLRFDSVASAANCQRAMHGRWYARRCISAIYMRPQDYEANFGSS